MDVDKEFEFECPQYFDFENALLPDQDTPLSPGLNSSWFERDHPLHEPTNPVSREEALKPLINLNELRPVPAKKPVQKPANPPNKCKTAKKSMGRNKPFVRLKRGEHGPNMQQQGGTKTAVQRKKSVGVVKLRGNSNVVAEKRDIVGNEFNLGQGNVFTPPWRQHYDSPVRAASCSIPESPKSSITKTVSPSGNQSQQPKHAAAPNASKSAMTSSLLAAAPNASKSAMTAALSSSSLLAAAASTHAASLYSPCRASPKDSLLAKATVGPCQKNRPRRLLPKTPLESEGAPAMIPLRAPLRSDKDDLNSPPLTPDETTSRDAESTTPEPTPSPTIAPSRATTSCSSAREEGDGSSMREKLGDLEQPQEETKVLSVEEMLKLHNKRVVSANAKYDQNGRRIRPGPTSFCPAPDRPGQTAEDKAKATKSSRRSVHSTSGKRPSTVAENKKPLPKNKNRRSCIAAPVTTSSSTTSDNSKDTRLAAAKAMKRSINTAEMEKAQKNKRRSCVVESTTTGKTGSKQKRRSCMAAPQAAIDRADEELKDLIARHNQRLTSKSCSSEHR
ncbi:proteoglycan 4 [Nematostella vectensis]|uniref:proteoglycan 4 n=1 Tax=Nematostella vectensis TaxID=45351 RepID=UPI0020774368|nr:proteoglycan 4 [Nematostella vectensis]